MKIALVTCGNIAEARRIARAVVEANLAACANVVSEPIESIYRWKGRVERAKEFLLILKTSRARLRRLEMEVIRLHSYDVPEFLVLGVDGGSKKYLQWLLENV